MDLACPRCGEYWDNDELHDNDFDLSYSEAVKLFRTKGCSAVWHTTCVPNNSLRTQASAALMDLMPDDMDGVSAMMDDFEFLGMLD